jgi:hypothetical protein
MTYTPNVPQVNQTIAASQPIINTNFTLLPQFIGQEHNYVANAPASCYHLQASMPNKVANPALPASTNGQYYVCSVSANSVPKFKSDTFGDLFLQTTPVYNYMASGTVTIQKTSGSTVTVVTVPANSFGTLWIQSQTSATWAYIQFSSFNGSVNIPLVDGSVSSLNINNVNINLTTSSYAIRAKCRGSSDNLCNYLVQYYTP